MANFEAFCWNILLSANLLFLKSEFLSFSPGFFLGNDFCRTPFHTHKKKFYSSQYIINLSKIDAVSRKNREGKKKNIYV